MTKTQIQTLSVGAIILLLTNNVFAGIGVEAGAFLKAWNAAHHWQGIAAGSIGVSMMTAFGSMKPLPNPVASKARAFGIVVVGCLAIGFFLAEYWFVVETAYVGATNIIESAIDWVRK